MQAGRRTRGEHFFLLLLLFVASCVGHEGITAREEQVLCGMGARAVAVLGFRGTDDVARGVRLRGDDHSSYFVELFINTWTGRQSVFILILILILILIV